MLETIEEEIVKVIKQEEKKDMDLEERRVMEESYPIFIRDFSNTFSWSFNKIEKIVTYLRIASMSYVLKI